MPEFRESLAHYLYLFWFYHHHRTNWVLLALWADMTNADAKRTGKGKDGLVQRLDRACTLKRGCNMGQTDIFPPFLRQPKAKAGDPSNTCLKLENLTLTDLAHTPRAIYLIFGYVRLKVSVWHDKTV